MKILLVSQYYPPENVLIPSDIARHLGKSGHRVRVLTGFPNYPEGKLYDGYKQFWRSRESDGVVDILRVPLYVDHSQNMGRRVSNYLSFGASAATARGFARGADVVYVYATQMTPALGPWLWRLTGGAPYVLHVQDLWPDSILGSSMMRSDPMGRAVDFILTPWLRSVYRNAAAVVGIAPTMVATLIDRGASADRTEVVYNWAEAASSLDSGSCTKAVGDHANIVYAGNVGEMQDLETAVRAVYCARDAGVELSVVGDGVALPVIRALCTELGVSNVRFLGRVPREQMDTIYSRADYALITLKDLPAFRGTIPSKFQAALAHGIPVISAVQGDLRNLVEDLGVGFTANVEDAESLAGAFRAAATQSELERTQMAERARVAYVNQFSQASGVEAIEKILIDAAQHRGRTKEEVNATA